MTLQLREGHTDPPCAACDRAAVEASTDLAVMRVIVEMAFEAIAVRDFEVAHGHEDAGHMLLCNRATEGAGHARALAELLIPLCRTEYPRWAA